MKVDPSEFSSCYRIVAIAVSVTESQSVVASVVVFSVVVAGSSILPTIHSIQRFHQMKNKDRGPLNGSDDL